MELARAVVKAEELALREGAKLDGLHITSYLRLLDVHATLISFRLLSKGSHTRSDGGARSDLPQGEEPAPTGLRGEADSRQVLLARVVGRGGRSIDLSHSGRSGLSPASQGLRQQPGQL